MSVPAGGQRHPQVLRHHQHPIQKGGDPQPHGSMGAASAVRPPISSFTAATTVPSLGGVAVLGPSTSSVASSSSSGNNTLMSQRGGGGLQPTVSSSVSASVPFPQRQQQTAPSRVAANFVAPDVGRSQHDVGLGSLQPHAGLRRLAECRADLLRCATTVPSMMQQGGGALVNGDQPRQRRRSVVQLPQDHSGGAERAGGCSSKRGSHLLADAAAPPMGQADVGVKTADVTADKKGRLLVVVDRHEDDDDDSGSSEIDSGDEGASDGGLDACRGDVSLNSPRRPPSGTRPPRRRASPSSPTASTFYPPRSASSSSPTATAVRSLSHVLATAFGVRATPPMLRVLCEDAEFLSSMARESEWDPRGCEESDHAGRPYVVVDPKPSASAPTSGHHHGNPNNKRTTTISAADFLATPRRPSNAQQRVAAAAGEATENVSAINRRLSCQRSSADPPPASDPPPPPYGDPTATQSHRQSQQRSRRRAGWTSRP